MNKLKKSALCILILLLFSSVHIPSSASAQAPAGQIGFRFNGKDLTWDANVYGSLIKKEGRTFVPLRIVSEKIGCEVIWHEDTKTAEITQGDVTISFTIGKNFVQTQQGSLEIDVAPYVSNGRTYVPMRALFVNLNYNVLALNPSMEGSLDQTKDFYVIVNSPIVSFMRDNDGSDVGSQFNVTSGNELMFRNGKAYGDASLIRRILLDRDYYDAIKDTDYLDTIINGKPYAELVPLLESLGLRPIFQYLPSYDGSIYYNSHRLSSYSENFTNLNYYEAPQAIFGKDGKSNSYVKDYSFKDDVNIQALVAKFALDMEIYMGQSSIYIGASNDVDGLRHAYMRIFNQYPDMVVVNIAGFNQLGVPEATLTALTLFAKTHADGKEIYAMLLDKSVPNDVWYTAKNGTEFIFTDSYFYNGLDIRIKAK